MSGTLTTEFAYNGAGDRVAKTVDGVTTDYVLDGSTGLTTGPAAGLTQVLVESTGGQQTAYLYGHDLLAQYDSGTWAYHVNDGLGSVRQLADPVGQVVQSYSFSPFGVPLGESGGEPYGYTGEQWDASAGLVFLRARYYDPGVGRFTRRDPSRLEANPYLYATGDPINLIDPSGLSAIVCGPETRNLTGWLVREMHHQSNTWPVQEGPLGMGIAPFNRIGNALLGDAWSESDVWLRALAGQVLDLPGLSLNAQQRAELDRIKQEAATGVLFRGAAYIWWAEMVRDSARWDFKDAIKAGLRESIMLCGTDECGWFEYSMPGNIFYAYVGRAAGFSEFEIRAGAVYAQQTDPENIRWQNDWYGLDQKTDVAALELGFELYDLTAGGTASEDILRTRFKDLVKTYRNRLAQADEPTEPYFTDFPIGPDGPEFPLRYFDGHNFLGIFGGW